MSIMKIPGIIGDHLTAPVAGVSMGYGPLGFGAISSNRMGGLGGFMPVSFDSKTRSVLHPIGMPITTTLNPINPYDMNATIVSNPFGGLSGLSGLSANAFGLLNSIQNTKYETYKKNNINVTISGCATDVAKVIECLDKHLSTPSV